MPEWLSLENDTVRLGLIAAGVLVLLVYLLRVARSLRSAARVRREIRRNHDQPSFTQGEVAKLSGQIVTESSTADTPGYTVVRHVETVMTEPRASSVAAIDMVKAHAAQKGANAVINVKTRKTSDGMWVANAEGVVVRLAGRQHAETD